MKHIIENGIFIVVLGLFPISAVLAGETQKEIPGESLEAAPGTIGTYTVEGKLLKIEGEFWVLEDLLGNQHRLHIEAETRLPQSPKQPGDSVHAVVRNDGQAQLIQ